MSGQSKMKLIDRIIWDLKKPKSFIGVICDDKYVCIIKNISYKGILKTAEIKKWCHNSKDIKTEFQTSAMLMGSIGIIPSRQPID